MTEFWRQLGLWSTALDRISWPALRVPNLFSRLRIIDAVVIAGVAMLLLKGASLVTDDFWASAPAPPPAEASGELPAFARVLSRARTNSPGSEVAMTGTVPHKPDDPPPKPATPEPKAGAGKPDPAAAPPTQATSPAERALLERLGERRDELQQRSRDIEMRERLIENIERKLDVRLNELRSSEGKGAEGRRGEPDPALRNLVTMYETMKPKDAARVFDRLSLDVLVPLVQSMNPRKMAEVLAVMTPEAAGKLTAALAKLGRSAEPRPAGATATLPPNELPAIDPTRAR